LSLLPLPLPFGEQKMKKVVARLLARPTAPVLSLLLRLWYTQKGRMCDGKRGSGLQVIGQRPKSKGTVDHAKEEK
jgi:hypothetical protein